MQLRLLIGFFTWAICMSISSAKEGMYLPQQSHALGKDLKKMGLELDPGILADLTSSPMNAIVSLGGCSGSFVSNKGLVITNHHCVRGSIQYNSTPEKNYMKSGFMAAKLSEELPAAPGSRIFITQSTQDVTSEVLGRTSQNIGPRDRYENIERSKKKVIEACENHQGVRCQIAAHFGGLKYELIKRLEIRDVRLAYAPSDSIGRYGGDIDNWMWPRHTGDFAFLRAYVAPDGSPADFSEENIPYQPSNFLKVSASGLEADDFVLAAGYPGSTSRYARSAEVSNTFNWFYPNYQRLIIEWIQTIKTTSTEGSDARIKYESLLASLNNYQKNIAGQLAGARRVGLIDRRQSIEEQLNDWINGQPKYGYYANAIEELDAISLKEIELTQRDFAYTNATRAQLLGVAQRLYRLSLERQKLDADREPGYQKRDLLFFQQRLRRIDRRYDPSVDKAIWLLFIREYLEQSPDRRIQAFDQTMSFDEGFVSADLDDFYKKTTLNDVEVRVALMDATPEIFEASVDPFIQLAVSLHQTEMDLEEERKTLAGTRVAWAPLYMDAVRDWQRSQGKITYPDANSTLRITYGRVRGGSIKDGLIYEPFTRVEGIIEKNTGAAPFNAPQHQLKLIRNKEFGQYEARSLGSIPVNFLSDLDSTGGNSGSATLNSRGELVGLLFDGTIESVNSDWDFEPKTTRTIHVDSRYILWIMEKHDGASRLIDEITVVY